MTRKYWIFVFLLLLYAVYASVYIYRTSFVVSGQRYFVLFDDAMISMRYAKNLARGYGLVWNPGEQPVEGYTNPLWVVFMAIFHLLPISASKISLLIQASGAVLLIANLVYVRKINQQISGSYLLAFLAVVLTAFYTPLNNWGLQGMEVSALTLLLSVSTWLGINCVRENRFSPSLWVLLGIGTLIRIDMAVPYFIFLVVLLLALPGHRHQILIWGFGIFLFFILGQTFFRLIYYGDVLPNTYYLKMSGYPVYLRLARGVYVLVEFIVSMNWVLFLIPFLVLVFRRDYTILLIFLIVLGQMAYSVYVGGDAWEHRGGSNRFISIGMPLFFILFVYVADHLREILANIIETPSRYTGIYANLGLVAFVIASMVNFNNLLDLKSAQRWALLRQPIFIEGNKEYIRIALAVRKITTPQAKVAVVSAGAIPYFSDRQAIDLLGKNDKIIAHEEVRDQVGLRNVNDFRPGHMKWDYDYSLRQLKPDVVTQLWGDTEEAKAYLNQNYIIGGAAGDMAFYLRSDSPNILWDRVQLVP